MSFTKASNNINHKNAEILKKKTFFLQQKKAVKNKIKKIFKANKPKIKNEEEEDSTFAV